MHNLGERLTAISQLLEVVATSGQKRGLVCVASYRLDGVVVSTSGAGEEDPGSNPGRGILFNATFIHSGNLRSNLNGDHVVRRLWLSSEGTSSHRSLDWGLLGVPVHYAGIGSGAFG